jgi:diguanylate cyclase (GGDEF)-like protein
MIATAATSLLLSGFFFALFLRIRRSAGEALHYYFIYAILAATNAVFLAAFAVFINSPDDLTRLNISNRITIVAATFTIALAIHFFCSFYDYRSPIKMAWIYAGNLLFSVLAAIPHPLFLSWESARTSQYYVGLGFGPLFQLWGAYIFLLAVHGLVVLLLIYRRDRRRSRRGRPLRLLLGAFTIWLLTGIADDLTGVQVVDLPPATWIGSFLIIVAIAWALVAHVESLYDERRALHNELIHDHLTKVYSRSYFELRVAETISQADRTTETSAFIALVDVDDFKRINDTRGHAVGDEVLSAVAQTMRSCVRDTDIVARHGGDEFAILLAGVNTDDNLSMIVERIREAIAQMRFPQPHDSLVVTCSMGVARLTGGQAAPDSDNSLRAADEALYASKARGKNAVSIAQIEPTDQAYTGGLLAGGSVLPGD